MTRPADFPRKVKLAAWHRAGGPDDPRCECYLVTDRNYEDCGRQPITKSDPAEYHHLEEAEGGENAKRRRYLRCLENCACVRHSCHLIINRDVSVPKITKSRHQREREAGIKRQPKRKIPYRRFDGTGVDPNRRTG